LFCLKDRVWFQTNLGFIKTKTQFIVKYRDSISGDMQDYRGRLHFRLKGFPDITYQITTKGKLGIFYPDGVSYEDSLEKVKPFLVKADGTPLDKFELIKEPDLKQKTLETKVKESTELLRFLLMRDPTPKEIAYEVGEKPEKIRVAFKLAPKLKWKEPNEDDVKKANKKIKEVYQIASLLQKFGKPIVFTRPTKYLGGRIWKDVLERVDYALKWNIIIKRRRS